MSEALALLAARCAQAPAMLQSMLRSAPGGAVLDDRRADLRLVATLPPQPRFVITGIGTSEGPARLLTYLLSEHAGVAARFLPLSRFAGATLGGALGDAAAVLVVFSQGLSPNAQLALAQGGRFAAVVVYTSVPDDDARVVALRNRGVTVAVLPPGPQSFGGPPLGVEDRLFLRVLGPAAAQLAAAQLAEAVAARRGAAMQLAEGVAARGEPEAQLAEGVAARGEPEAQLAEGVTARGGPEAQVVEGVTARGGPNAQLPEAGTVRGAAAAALPIVAAVQAAVDSSARTLVALTGLGAELVRRGLFTADALATYGLGALWRAQPELPLALVTSGGYGELCLGLRWKFLEGVGLNQPVVWDVLQVAHGPLQQTFQRPLLWCVLSRGQCPTEQALLTRLQAMLPPHHVLLHLPAAMPGPLALFEHDLACNALVLSILRGRDWNLLDWPGRQNDGPLYALTDRAELK